LDTFSSGGGFAKHWATSLQQLTSGKLPNSQQASPHCFSNTTLSASHSTRLHMLSSVCNWSSFCSSSGAICTRLLYRDGGLDSRPCGQSLAKWLVDWHRQQRLTNRFWSAVGVGFTSLFWLVAVVLSGGRSALPPLNPRNDFEGGDYTHLASADWTGHDYWSLPLCGSWYTYLQTLPLDLARNNPRPLVTGHSWECPELSNSSTCHWQANYRASRNYQLR